MILYFILDKMKDAIIAKLANQAADYYGDAFKQCQYKDTLPKVSNKIEMAAYKSRHGCILWAKWQCHVHCVVIIASGL